MLQSSAKRRSRDSSNRPASTRAVFLTTGVAEGMNDRSNRRPQNFAIMQANALANPAYGATRRHIEHQRVGVAPLYTGMRLQIGNLLFELRGEPNIVSIEKSDIGSAGYANAGITRRGRAAILLQQKLHVVVIGGDLNRTVGLRTVVDD